MMSRKGFTVIELMITILIVVILTVSFGGALSGLLCLHEKDREEGYMREKLAYICGEFADYFSLADKVGRFMDENGKAVYAAGFRMEADGVSYETGKVVKVSNIYVSATNGIFNVAMRNADARYRRAGDSDDVFYKRQEMSSDGMLYEVMSKITVFSIDPLPIDGMWHTNQYYMLTVAATNGYFDIRGATNAIRTVVSRRAFRLWNAE